MGRRGWRGAQEGKGRKPEAGLWCFDCGQTSHTTITCSGEEHRRAKGERRKQGCGVSTVAKLATPPYPAPSTGPFRQWPKDWDGVSGALAVGHMGKSWPYAPCRMKRSPCCHALSPSGRSLSVHSPSGRSLGIHSRSGRSLSVHSPSGRSPPPAVECLLSPCPPAEGECLLVLPPQPKGEEPERPQPEREESEHPTPEWEEPKRPTPEWGEPERPKPKRGESVRPQPKREESVRPQPKEGGVGASTALYTSRGTRPAVPVSTSRGSMPVGSPAAAVPRARRGGVAGSTP
ncbi:UNVERIFIED_CONTAM: hypothetical protein FKN15_051515 [Acipenser sinensis]